MFGRCILCVVSTYVSSLLDRYNKIHDDLLSPLPLFLVVFLVYALSYLFIIAHVYQLLAGSLCMNEHD